MAKLSGAVEITADVRLSRVTCSNGDDYFELSIGDRDAACEIISIKLTDKQFADLLSNRSIYPGPKASVWPDVVGTKHEHKMELIRLNKDGVELAFSEQDQISAIEDNGGWVANERDLRNQHRHVYDKKEEAWYARVSFFRNVKKTPE